MVDFKMKQKFGKRTSGQYIIKHERLTQYALLVPDCLEIHKINPTRNLRLLHYVLAGIKASFLKFNLC